MNAPLISTEMWESMVTEITRLRAVVENGQKGSARRSPTTAKITAALAKAQGQIEAPKKSKTAQVRSEKGNYSFSYATLADVIEVIKRPLAEAGICWTQDVVQHGDRHFMMTRLDHEDEWVVGLLPMPNPHGLDPQKLGSLVTYMKRYGLSLLLGIAADEDDDGNTAMGNYRDIHDRGAPPPPPRNNLPRGEAARQRKAADDAEDARRAAQAAGPASDPPPPEPGDPGPGGDGAPPAQQTQAAVPVDAQKALRSLSTNLKNYLDAETGEVKLKEAEDEWVRHKEHFTVVLQHTVDALVDRYRKLFRRDPPAIEGVTYPEKVNA
jgi:hypothetical protein